jgi:hypothetical protein
VRSHKKEAAAAQEKESVRKPDEAPKGTPGGQSNKKTPAAARRDRRNKSKEQEHGAYSKSAQKTGFMECRPPEVLINEICFLMNDTDEDCQDLADTMPGNIKKQDRITVVEEQAAAGSSQRAGEQHEQRSSCGGSEGSSFAGSGEPRASTCSIGSSTSSGYESGERAMRSASEPTWSPSPEKRSRKEREEYKKTTTTHTQKQTTKQPEKEQEEHRKKTTQTETQQQHKQTREKETDGGYV